MNSSRFRASHALFYLSLFIGLLFIGTRIDNDDWFLLSCGRYVANFGIPHVEPITMHEGFHYVMQQWLFALGLFRLYEMFGILGLVLFAHVGGAVVLLLYDRLVHLAAGGDSRAAELYLVLPVGIVTAFLFFYPRPQVVSMTFFLCEVLLLERYRNVRPRWIFAVLPAMSALLVNLHAALWPMFLILQLPYLAEAIFGGWLARWLPHDAAWKAKEILLLLVLCAAAGLCNPYGVEAMTYTALSYSAADLHTTIGEVRALSLDIEPRVWFGGFFFLLYGGMTIFYARRPQPLRFLLLTAGTGILGLLSLRSLFLFLMLGTFPVARALAGHPLPFAAWPERRKQLIAALLAIDAALYAAVTFPLLYTMPPVPPQYTAAVQELARIAAAEGKSPHDFRIYASGNFGGYAEFHGFRSYMDTRAEVFFRSLNQKKDVFHEYILMQRGRLDYHDVLAAYPFDVVVIDNKDILWTYLPRDPDYTCVWDSTLAGVNDQTSVPVRIYQKK